MTDFSSCIQSGMYLPSSFENISKKLLQVFTANSADTVIIAFDRYIFPSIKDNEHSLRKRTKGQRFHINGPDQIRPSNFADALKNIYFKEALVDFIIDDWANDYMAPFIGSKTILVNYLQCYQYKVCEGKVQRTPELSLACPGHEEADTKIVFHVCHLTSDAHVTIRCSDTDILIIMLANMNSIQTDLQISMHVGTGNNQKFINVTKLSQEKNCLSNCNLDQLFATLEEYVCRLYAFTRVNDINVARVMTFTKSYGNNDDCNPLNLKKRIDGSLFPPCKAELQQHFLRTAYIAHLWSHAHRAMPTDLLPTEYGWEESEEKYYFKWFTGDQLPPSITSITNLDMNPHEDDETENDGVCDISIDNCDDDSDAKEDDA
ncbi:uncharacterized protein LOC124645572 [Helicoverpa zea]|uniref:uncharacterized protein LOC124645572 n=1 Tax=Helicoverpa zea TaxID=7113 RepID=UPI001F597A5C|nr:uncharacterized protein LOC124645572 [Helicoverpa zea]